MSRSVHVHAPSRLHFGMFSFGHTDRPQFGGVGVMIEPPAVDVSITPSTEFSAHGDLSARVVAIVNSLVERWELGTRPPCAISVEAPRNHTGLGVGTQLSLAVGVGVRQFLELPSLSILDIAETLGRASRSSIGSLGFHGGGLIVDYGKYPGEQCVAFLREVLPSEWRFVLMARRDQQGLMGAVETQAFTQLPPVPESVTARLHHISNNELTSAVAWKNCADFGEAVYQFGRLAGECFAPVQGGPYANFHIAELIQAIRDYGIPGVGQSSWGPTVFAITTSEDEARTFVDWFAKRFDTVGYDITIASPNNTGAQITLS